MSKENPRYKCRRCLNPYFEYGRYGEITISTKLCEECYMELYMRDKVPKSYAHLLNDKYLIPEDKK